MDAGADPLRPARPEEGDEKPKPAESQDDGYETSNSGEAARRKPSSAEGSPAPPPARPTPPDLPPPPPDPPYETMLRYQQPDPEPYRHFEQPAPPPLAQPEPQYFPFPKYNEPYSYKRDELPYDMSQHHHQHQPPHQQHQQHTQYAPPHLQKRDDDIYNGIKRECEDPYSFVEDEAMCVMLQQPQQQPLHPAHLHPDHHQHMMHQQQMLLAQPKKRGRKKKIKDENGMEIKADGSMEGALVPRPVKERKKHDRFNGMSEEEVSRRTLPDHLAENLDIIIIGINPGLFAAYKGHHYAGPGNHFWKCLYLSGLTREQMSADEDYKLLNFGIGFTNMVPRPTKGSADLTRREIKEGSAVLLEKLQTFRPKVAVFNGKLIYEVFSGKKDFCFGKQPDTIAGTNTYMWVMPSSSARCAQLPRAADKVPFYAALKKFRDYLNGLVAHLDEAELVFPDTTSRRPQDEMEIRRLTTEPEPGDTIILEDGTEVPLKKKRGRPKKVKLENGETAPPAPRAPRQPRPPPALDQPGDQPPKKKRGRPKKVRPEDQQFLMQQQPQQQSGNSLSQSALSLAHEQGYLPPHQGEFPHQLPSPGSLLYHHQSLADNSSYFQPQPQQPQPQPQPQSQPTPTGMESPLDVSGALGLSRAYGSPGGSGAGGAGAAAAAAGGTNPSAGFCSSPRGVYASPVSQGYSPGGGTPGPSFPGSPGGVGGGVAVPVGGAGSSGYHSPAARAPFSGRSPLYAHSPAHQPYHHHHHLQTQQASPVAQNRYSQSPHPHHPLPYSRSPVPQTQSRPYSRSPVGGGGSSTPFPASSPAGGGGGGGYTPSPAHTPYSHRSSPAPAARTPVYTDAHHFTHQGGGAFGGELSQEIGAAISSPGPVSPGMAALDFEPPRDPERAASPDLHPASTSDSSLSEYNKPLSCERTPGGGAELSPGGVPGPGPGPGVGSSPFGALYETEVRLGYSHGLHHAHSPAAHDPYRTDQGNGMAESPRLDQLHQHPSMYPSNFNRSTPPSGVEGPFSPLAGAAFRPPPAEHPHTPQPPHTPHTPHTPLHHQPGSPGEFSGAVKTKSQDVASKSLSGLESLVDQIPSIAEGPGGGAGAVVGGAGQGQGEQAAPGPAAVPALPEYAPALYGPYGAYGGAAYGNNGYGTPFVGYGGGWGAAVMRPAPGYLPEWQYGYGPTAYAPYNAPYYNGYAAPPPAHHQQAHYLSAPPLIDLHKNGEHSAGVPSVPSVPSVGFGGFC